MSLIQRIEAGGAQGGGYRPSHRRIRLKEVLELVPLSTSTIYARMKAGTFPRSQNLGGGVVCWRESEILEWLDALPESGSDDSPKS